MPSSYILTGRGGAGNIRTSQPDTKTPSTSYSTAPRYMSSGIGGAGNIHVSSSAAAHAALQDDMLKAAQAASRSTPAAYVGRGGAGNIYRSRNASTSSSVCSDAASEMSASSLGSKAKGWVNAALKRS